MIEKYLQKVVQELNLSKEEAKEAMRAMMSGKEDELQGDEKCCGYAKTTWNENSIPHFRSFSGKKGGNIKRGLNPFFRKKVLW